MTASSPSNVQCTDMHLDMVPYLWLSQFRDSQFTDNRSMRRPPNRQFDQRATRIQQRFVLCKPCRKCHGARKV
ncbi:g10171 [Coccomyxa elongata]